MIMWSRLVFTSYVLTSDLTVCGVHHVLHVLLQIHWPQALPKGVAFADFKDEHYLGYSEETIADTWKVNIMLVLSTVLIEMCCREWRNVLLRAWPKALAYPTSPSKRQRTC